MNSNQTIIGGTIVILSIIIIAMLSRPAMPLQFDNNTDLSLVNEETSIGGVSYKIISVYAWRDFMPLFPEPSVRSLILAIEITAIDQSEFPKYVDADFIWLFHEDGAIWNSSITEDQSDTSSSIKKRIGSGPAWDVGTNMDIVIRLAQNGIEDLMSYFYIKILNISIFATY